MTRSEDDHPAGPIRTPLRSRPLVPRAEMDSSRVIDRPLTSSNNGNFGHHGRCANIDRPSSLCT
jgi:hypothetical protein